MTRERDSLRALRTADAAVSRPRAQRLGARGGGGPPRSLLVLPQALSLRGASAAVRAAGGGGADAAGAEAEARRASNAAAVKLFAGAALRPDDHVQLAGSRSARQRLRGNAELLREPDPEALAPRWEVDRRLRVAEAVRAADLLHAVGERQHAVGDVARVDHVAAAVEDDDRDPPGRRQDGGLAPTALAAAPMGDEDRSQDDREDHERAAENEVARSRAALDQPRQRR